MHFSFKSDTQRQAVTGRPMTGEWLRRSSMRLAFLLAATSAHFAAHAIDVDPGDYVPASAGTTIGLLYYQHALRDASYAQGARQPGDPGLTSNIGIARMVHYMTLGGLTVAPQFLLPFGRTEGKDDTRSLGRTTGVGDVILATPVWLVNDPGSKTYWAVAPYLYLPTGSYEGSRSLNLGDNRWKFNLQTGLVKGLTNNWYVDLTGDVMLYGKNDDYGSTGAKLKQDPLVQAQAYLRYQFNAGANVYVGLSRTWGGETQVDGVAQNDEARQLKASVGSSYFIRPKTQLMAAVGRDLQVSNGFKESLRINLRVLHVF